MSQKIEKPILSGQRIKTRKRGMDKLCFYYVRFYVRRVLSRNKNSRLQMKEKNMIQLGFGMRCYLAWRKLVTT